MRAVFKRELRAYFTGVIGYIFCFILLLIVGVYTYFHNISNLNVSFEVTLGTSSYLFLMLAVPVLSMRVIAEERRQNTDKLLYSLPLSSSRIVLAKYLAMLVVFLVPLAVISLYPLMLARYGAVSLLTCYSTLLAFFLIGAAMLALGMFMSSLTDNQLIAAVLTFAVIVTNYFISGYASGISGTAETSLIVLSCLAAAAGAVTYGMTRGLPLSAAVAAVLEGALVAAYYLRRVWLENLVYRMAMAISAFKRLNTFVNDLFDLTGVVFYMSLAALFVFFTVQSFEKRRWS